MLDMGTERVKKILDYEVVVVKHREREEYRVDILENGKYISSKIYNHYEKNRAYYNNLKIGLKNYALMINDNNYEKIIVEVLNKYHNRDKRAELLDNTKDLLLDINEILDNALDNCYIDLNKEQRSELTEIVKAAIKNYVEEL